MPASSPLGNEGNRIYYWHYISFQESKGLASSLLFSSFASPIISSSGITDHCFPTWSCQTKWISLALGWQDWKSPGGAVGHSRKSQWWGMLGASVLRNLQSPPPPKSRIWWSGKRGFCWGLLKMRELLFQIMVMIKLERPEYFCLFVCLFFFRHKQPEPAELNPLKSK